VFGYDHEAIFIRHYECFAHRAIDSLTDGLFMGGGFALSQVDAD
jgi:hypothetical protein